MKPLGYRVALSGKTHIGPKDTFPFEYSGKKNPDMDAIGKLFSECKESSTPFCLFACSNEPHSPWNKGDASRYPPEKVKLPPYIVDTPEMRADFSDYLAEITYYDDQVGEVLGLLKQHGLSENTMVVVVSEQGNSFPFAKWTCYSNGLQSAMIVRWPGKVTPGSKTDAMVEYTDIAPTFVDAAGAQPSDTLDGQSFVNVLQGKTDHHKDFVFGEMTTRGIINGSDAYGIRTIRGKRYRLIWNLHHETKFTNACTSAGYFRSMVEKADGGDISAQELVNKYHYRPEFELYDCNTDPLEMTNLAGEQQHAVRLGSLKAELVNWMNAQGDSGKQTELDAVLHQGRYKSMAPDEARKAYTKARNAKLEKKKSGRGKRKTKVKTN